MLSKNSFFKSLSLCAAFSVLGTNFLQASDSPHTRSARSNLNGSKTAAKKGRSNNELKNKKVISRNKTFNLNAMIDDTLSNDGENFLNSSKSVAKKERSHKKAKNKKVVYRNKTFDLNKMVKDALEFLSSLKSNKVIKDIYKFASSPLVYPSLLTLPPVLLAILLSPEGNKDKNAKKVQNNPSKNKPTGKPSSPSNKNSSGKTGGAPQEHLSPIVYDEWSDEDRDFIVGCVIICLIVAVILYLIFKPNNLYSKSKLDKEKIAFFDEKTGDIIHIPDLKKSQDKGKSINLLNTMYNRDIGYLNKEEHYFRVGNEIIYLDEQKELYEKVAHLNKTNRGNNIKNIKKKEKKLKKKGGPRNVYDVLPILEFTGSNCSILSAFYLMYSPEYKVLYDILRFLDKEVLLECLKIVLNDKSLKEKKPFLFSNGGDGDDSSYEKFKKLSADEQKKLLEFYKENKLLHLTEFPELLENEDTVKMENRVMGKLTHEGEAIDFGTLRRAWREKHADSTINPADTLKCFGFYLGRNPGEFQGYYVEEFKGICVGEFFTNSKILQFCWGTTTDSRLLEKTKEKATFFIQQCCDGKDDEETIYLKLPENNFIDGPLPNAGYSSVVKKKWQLEDLKKEFPEMNFGVNELFKKFEEDERNYYRKQFIGKQFGLEKEKYKKYTEEQYIEEKIKESREKFNENEIKDYIGQGYWPISLIKQMVREKIKKEKNINLSDEEYEKMWSDDTVFFLDDKPGKDRTDQKTGKVFPGADTLPTLGKSVTFQTRKNRDDQGFSAGYREKKTYIAAISVHTYGHWYCLQPKYKWDSDRGEYVISRWVKLSCLNSGHKLLNKNGAEEFLKRLFSQVGGARQKRVPMRVITQEEIEACPEYYIMDEEGNMGMENNIRPGALKKNKGGYIPEEWQEAFKQVCEKYKDNGETLSGNKKENESDVSNGNNIDNKFEINTNSNQFNHDN